MSQATSTPKETQFKRKTYAKGFSNHKGLDDFIQSSLDKYHFVDPKDEMYEATGVYSKYIVSNKSAIPDLVIWNKKFNKNECFYEATTKDYLAFPRVKFILKAKPPNNLNFQGNPRKSGKNLTHVKETGRQESNRHKYEDDEHANYDRFEEEDVQWEDVDVKELESMKMKFQALPKDVLNFKKEKVDDKNEQDEDKLGGLEEEQEDVQIIQQNNQHLQNNISKNLIENKFDQKKEESTVIHEISKIDLEEKNEVMPTFTENLSVENFFRKEETVISENSRINTVTEVERNVIPLEKNSLFEKDFTLMFLGDSNKNNTNNLNGSFSQNQSFDRSFENKNNYRAQDNMNNRNNNFSLEQNNNFDDIFIPNLNMQNMQNMQNLHKMPNMQMPYNNKIQNNNQNPMNNYSNINNMNSVKYSNLNLESEIQLNLNSDFDNKRKNIPGLGMSGNNSNRINQGMNMNMSMGMNPMGMNKNPIKNINNINNMNPMNNMNNMKNPQQMLMQPFLLPFPNMNAQFENMQNFQGPQNIQNMQMNPNMSHNFEQEEEDMSNLLENPVNIVQKNMNKRGWFLMAERDKILGNFNSMDLLNFLEEKFRSGSKFEGMWLTDYDTDIYFTPSNLYEILTENLPKILENLKNKKNKNISNLNMPPNMMPKMPMRIGNMPFPEPILPPMMPPFDPRMNFNKGMDRSTNPPMNMNINLQVVKNNINLNNIMLGQVSTHPGNFGMPVPEFINMNNMGNMGNMNMPQHNKQQQQNRQQQMNNMNNFNQVMQNPNNSNIRQNINSNNYSQNNNAKLQQEKTQSESSRFLNNLFVSNSEDNFGQSSSQTNKSSIIGNKKKK